MIKGSSAIKRSKSVRLKETNRLFESIAEAIYARRTNKVESNFVVIREVFKQHNKVLAPALDVCPNLDIIVAHMLVFRLGWAVKDVGFTSKMTEWDEQDCRRVGRSIMTFMRTLQQGVTATEAWKLHYPQLNLLFDECEGMGPFMVRDDLTRCSTPRCIHYFFSRSHTIALIVFRFIRMFSFNPF